jgi:hypothetical protein
MTWRRILAFGSLCLALAGCGDEAVVIDGGLPDLSAADLSVPPPFCTDQQVGDAGLPPTLTNVQQVFNDNCIGCHCCGDNLTLSAGSSFAQLVNRMAPNSDNTINESCGGVLVTPGNPQASYLYQKITSTMPCAGHPMPLNEFTFTPLPMCEQDLVRRWILAGAPND